jgi:DNA-binding transcriptional regulator YdaS (Cro superfamily)
MSDSTPLTPGDYDVWKLASPAHLLALLKKLGVEGTVIASWLGVTPACVSQWHTGKRPIHPRYAPALREWAETAIKQAAQRTDKEVAAAPTDALRDATRAEFTAIWNHWKQRVLFDRGTLNKQIHQQYYALAGCVLKERYRPEDIENFELTTEAMAQQMKRYMTLQGEVPSAEEELIARLARAHEEAAATRSPDADPRGKDDDA